MNSVSNLQRLLLQKLNITILIIIYIQLIKCARNFFFFLNATFQIIHYGKSCDSRKSLCAAQMICISITTSIVLYTTKQPPLKQKQIPEDSLTQPPKQPQKGKGFV